MNQEHLELDKHYLESVNIAQQYHNKSEGLTHYEGSSSSDKIYPKQLNAIIILLLKLIRKVEVLENNKLQTNKLVESLENKFSKLTIQSSQDKLVVPQKMWIYY